MPNHPPAVPAGTHYTWDTVLAALGEPTADDLLLYAVTASPADEQAEGTRMGSHRIYTDILRWCGEFVDGWRAIPAADRDELPFDEGLVRVLGARGDELRKMDESFLTAADDQDKQSTADDADARAAFDAGDKTRELLHGALAGIARGTAKLEARVENAYGTHGDATALAKSLTDQIAIARELLAHPRSRAAKRLERVKLTPERLDAIEQQAKDLKAAGGKVDGAKRKGGGTEGAVTQAALDVKDGECLFLMTDVLHQLAAAHAIDPRVPVVHPIATRSYFTRSKPRSHTATEPAGGATAGAVTPSQGGGQT